MSIQQFWSTSTILAILLNCNILIASIKINDMKKYSSYANLKLAPTPKAIPAEYWPKITNIPSTRRAADNPLMMISKDPYAIPLTTKYSAGYLQRQKMFSSKKQNKDVTNVRVNGTVHNVANVHGPVYIPTYDGRIMQQINTRPSSSKAKKQDKEKSSKKQKSNRVEKYLELDNKQNLGYQKPNRYQVQSPKGFPSKPKQELLKQKQKEKSKSRYQEKQKQKQKERQKQKIQKAGMIVNNKNKDQSSHKKQEEGLKQYVTKYEPQPKSVLLHCTSQSNLIKTINLHQKKPLKGYYKSALYQAFFSPKSSSFSQICRNHLATSIQFLSYAKKNKHIIPTSVNRVNLAPTNRKTLIFDLDETLIHCNESLDKPHDVALEITFPNNSKIKAGINVRPYASECLKQLSKYFEIIVFTASHQCYANVIIDYLDPNRQFVSYRFFRQTCHKTEQGFYVKDLRVFGRDLSNLLLIDNAAYSYCFQPQNGVPIIPFYNNKADLQLKQITTYLKQFMEVKNMRMKNETYMRLSQYHHFTCPKQLINQLYF